MTPALLLLASIASLASAYCGQDTQPLSTREPVPLLTNDTSFRVALAELAGTVPLIPTWFHVVTDGVNGDISNQAINDQIAVLNNDFTGKFQFYLEGVTRRVNAKWFVANDQGAAFNDLFDMKTTGHKGFADTLNIHTSQPAGLLGVASFPWDYSGYPTYDGIVLKYTTLPGYPGVSGRTATHEVGHWLGLYHTFEKGCDAVNDAVDDTPASASASGGCPIGRDSCTGPSFPGLDPVTNYMDYSADSCVTGFTPGQYARMAAYWAKYRAPKV
ncbi:metalloprotease, partial [Obelidium mucronatum]